MTDLRRTPLRDAHVAAGAKLVPFAGWEMPIQYEGIIAEHMAVRERAGLFDVSHMGQLRVVGVDAIAAAQRLLSNDLSRIPHLGQAQYTMLLDDSGGIEDDLIAYRIDEHELLLVVNAANRAHDAQLLAGIAEDVSDGWAMLALQGRNALQYLIWIGGPDLQDLRPFEFVGEAFADHACVFATTGYTGERGCEILVPADGASDVWSALLDDPDHAPITPCGLGARDTLRLEACYPLHGNDIGPDRDPISAGLGFAAPAGIHASIDRIREQGPTQRLVPIRVDGRGIPRAGCAVLVDGAQVGTVSSGTMSPVLRTGIALAWIDAAHAAPETPVELDIRGTRAAGRIVQRPFVHGSL